MEIENGSWDTESMDGELRELDERRTRGVEGWAEAAAPAAAALRRRQRVSPTVARMAQGDTTHLRFASAATGMPGGKVERLPYQTNPNDRTPEQLVAAAELFIDSYWTAVQAFDNEPIAEEEELNSMVMRATGQLARWFEELLVPAARDAFENSYLDDDQIESVGRTSARFHEAVERMQKYPPEGETEDAEQLTRRELLVEVLVYYFAPGGAPGTLGWFLEEEVVDEYNWRRFERAMRWYYGEGGPADGQDAWLGKRRETDAYEQQRGDGAAPALGDASSKLSLVHYFWRTGRLPEPLRGAPDLPGGGDDGNESDDDAEGSSPFRPPAEYIRGAENRNELTASVDGQVRSFEAGARPTRCRAPFFHTVWIKKGRAEKGSAPGVRPFTYFRGLNRWRGQDETGESQDWFRDAALMDLEDESFAELDTFIAAVDASMNARKKRPYKSERVSGSAKPKHVYPADPNDPVINPRVSQLKMRTVADLADSLRRAIDVLRTAMPEQYGRRDSYKAMQVRDLMHFVENAENAAEHLLLVVHWRATNVSPGARQKRLFQLQKEKTKQASKAGTSEERETAARAGCGVEELQRRRTGKFTRGMFPEAEREWVNYVDPNAHANLDDPPTQTRNGKTVIVGPPPLNITIDDLGVEAKQYFQPLDDPRLLHGSKGANQRAIHDRAVAFRDACVALREAVGILLVQNDDPAHDNEWLPPPGVRKHELRAGSTGLPADGGVRWVSSRPPVEVGASLPVEEQPLRIGSGSLERIEDFDSIGDAYLKWITAALDFYRLFAPWPEWEPAEIDDTEMLRGVDEVYPEGQVHEALRELEHLKVGGSLNEYDPPLGTRLPDVELPPTFQHVDTERPTSVLFQGPLGWPGSDGWVPGAAHAPIWSNYAVQIQELKGYPHLRSPIPMHGAPDESGDPPAPLHDGRTELARIDAYMELYVTHERLLGLRERAGQLKRYLPSTTTRGRVPDFPVPRAQGARAEAAILATETEWFAAGKPWWPEYEPNGSSLNYDSNTFKAEHKRQLVDIKKEIKEMEQLILRERTVRGVWSTIAHKDRMEVHMRRLEGRIADEVRREQRRMGAAFSEPRARARAIGTAREAYGAELLEKAEAKAVMVVEVLRLRAAAHARNRLMDDWEQAAKDARADVAALPPIGQADDAPLSARRDRLKARAKARAWELLIDGQRQAIAKKLKLANKKQKAAKAKRTVPTSDAPAPRHRLSEEVRGVDRRTRRRRQELQAEGQAGADDVEGDEDGLVAEEDEGARGANTPDNAHERLYSKFVLAWAEATNVDAGTRQRFQSFATEYAKATIARRSNRFAVPGTNMVLSPKRIRWLQKIARRVTRMLGGFDAVPINDNETQEKADARYPGFSTSDTYGADRELPAAVQQFALEILSLLPSSAIAAGAFRPAARTADEAAEDRERWRRAIAALAAADRTLLRKPQRDSLGSQAKQKTERAVAAREARALFYDRRRGENAPPSLYELNLYKMYVGSPETREALKWIVERLDYWEPRLLRQLEVERNIAADQKLGGGRTQRARSLIQGEEVPMELLKAETPNAGEREITAGSWATIAAVRRNVEQVLLATRLTCWERVSALWGTFRSLWERGLLTANAVDREWGRLQEALPTMHETTRLFFQEFVNDVKEVQRWRAKIWTEFQSSMSLLATEHMKRPRGRDLKFFLVGEDAPDEVTDGPNWDDWPELLAEYRAIAEAWERGQTAADEAAADDAARRVRQQAGARTPWDTDAIQVIVALNFMLEFNTSLEPPIHALNDAVWPNYAAFKERALGRNPEATDMGRAGPVAMRGEGDPRYKETVESLRQEIAVKDAERVAAEAEGDNTSSFDAQIAVLQASLGALVQNEVTRLWYRRDMYRLYNVGEARGTRQPFNPTDNFEPPVPTVDDPTPSATQLRSYLVYEDVYREQKLYRWREEPSGPWVPFGSHTVAGRGVVRTPVLRGAISDELYEGTFARDDQYEPEPEPGPSLTRDTVAFELKGKPAWGYLKKGEARLFAKEALFGGPDATDSDALVIISGEVPPEEPYSAALHAYMFEGADTFPSFSDDVPATPPVWPSEPRDPETWTKEGQKVVNEAGIASSSRLRGAAYKRAVEHNARLNEHRAQLNLAPLPPPAPLVTAPRSSSRVAQEPVPPGLRGHPRNGSAAFSKLRQEQRRMLWEQGAGAQTVWYPHPLYFNEFPAQGLWYKLPKAHVYAQTKPNGWVRRRASVKQSLGQLDTDPNTEMGFLMAPVLTKFRELGWVRYERVEISAEEFNLIVRVEEDEAVLTRTAEGRKAMFSLLGKDLDGYDWEDNYEDNRWTAENFWRWFDFDRRKTLEVTLTPVGSQQVWFEQFESRRRAIIRTYSEDMRARLQEALPELPAPVAPLAPGPQGIVLQQQTSSSEESDSESDSDSDDNQFPGAGRADLPANQAEARQRQEQAAAASGELRDQRHPDGPNSLNWMPDSDFVVYWEGTGKTREEAEELLRWRAEQRRRGNTHPYTLPLRPTQPPPQDEVSEEELEGGTLALPMPGGQ